jgi:hypothetical protein
MLMISLSEAPVCITAIRLRLLLAGYTGRYIFNQETHNSSVGVVWAGSASALVFELTQAYEEEVFGTQSHALTRGITKGNLIE